ncbi:2-amino-4-hydroxy-6-hydroxymethyldihydropteridine diphosphokinase [Catenovulum sediminis]|uniref:2-amino-4-hydroxy-6-hydroxymethyldihydropteridine diphosphokinase n=1 Tax=Catenovulum sediminis TaxID=1740262 RepID=A0ABV1RLC9_9ALTE|nr:2-amino-4-hydroxy-6-hydroxymethyldihydropteridine diphosphokinase [Catenovulum sediminis]
MARVAVSLGTNTEAEFHLKIAIFLLRPFIQELVISDVYESTPVNFGGRNFYNIVFGGNTKLSLEHFIELLKSIEDQYGRDRNANNRSSITLDLDLLIYDDIICENPISLPRPEILKNAFVLKPLCDIYPDLLHPVVKKSYTLLWQNFDNPSQALWQIDFDWKK